MLAKCGDFVVAGSDRKFHFTVGCCRTLFLPENVINTKGRSLEDVSVVKLLRTIGTLKWDSSVCAERSAVLDYKWFQCSSIATAERIIDLDLQSPSTPLPSDTEPSQLLTLP
jgi:hypothetical protein